MCILHICKEGKKEVRHGIENQKTLLWFSTHMRYIVSNLRQFSMQLLNDTSNEILEQVKNKKDKKR